VKLLLDVEVSIGGINFFGGTMWTDFNGGDLRAMETARSQMNDYRLIYNPDETPFTPADSIALHRNFASKLLNWFGKNLSGPRVVISHNAPVINPNSKFKGGPLTPAFNSLDMVEIIETHQPALWVYGHTHECDDQMIGRTRIISNQLGYSGSCGGFECKDFDEAGLPVEVKT
jgi:Icc-related predicted phosphoesterase